MAAESIGNLVPTKIPGYIDQADIQAALRLYHYGSYTYDINQSDPAQLINPSIAYTINNLQDQITTNNTNAIQKTLFAAKGDLISAASNDTPEILSVGSNNQFLIVNSGTSTGLQWSNSLVSPIVSGLYLTDSSIIFEGSVSDEFETTLTVTNPTADRTITLPNNSGTVALLSDITYVGTTAISLSRASASQTLSGVSIDGNSATVTNGVYTTGSYSNPSWISSLAWSKISTTPTTLSGYGITDGQPLDADLTAIAALAGTSGFLKKTALNTWSLDTSTYLTGNQTITLSGDAAGSGTTAITLTLATVATPGTYKSVTVNAKGLVTSGTNPTTLSGYGITDAIDTSATAQTKSGNLTAAQFIRSGGSSGQFLKADGSVDSNTYLTTGTASSTYAALSGATFTGTIISPAATASISSIRIPHTATIPSLPTNGDMWTTTAGIYVQINGATVGPLASSAGTLSNPMTTLGDMIYGGASGAGTRLAGNTTTTPQFLRSTGSAGVATAPAWQGSVGSGNVVLATSPTISGGTHTGLTSLGIRDTSAAFDVTLAAVSSPILTAARTLTLNLQNADRTVSLAGNLTISAAATVSGTNTGDQTITLTGDVTGTGTGSFATALANSGVAAGTYNDSATAVRPFTVDAKGRITSIGTAVTITPAWSSIGSKPTTLSGFGITDGLSNSSTSTQSGYFGDIYLYDDSTPSHYLQITNSANLTLARLLSINVNDADRTISLSGNLTVSGAATISGTNTGDQTITLTGDVTGTGTGSFATTLATVATAGTYKSVTINAKGLVTSGTNPTTVSGYGITDAATLTGTETLTNKTLTSPQINLGTPNSQTGTTFTPALSDNGKMVTLNNASPITITVPTNSAAAFAVGAQINLLQIGDGQVTVNGDTGVTVYYTPGNKFREKYSSATLIKLDSNIWALVGDLSL